MKGLPPGVSENLLDRAREMAKECPKGGVEKDPPMDKDNLLMAPTEEWDRTDRKSSWTKVFSKPTRAFKLNYDNIDWTK